LPYTYNIALNATVVNHYFKKNEAAG
jgi:hypothetical protein